MLKNPVRMMRHGRPGAPSRQRGISLIEVLVSVVVLGIGLLGVAAMQSIALRGGQSSLESSQAVIQTTSILESMRTNAANAASYNTADWVCTAGTGGTLAQNDMRDWIDSLKTTMGTADDDTTCGRISGCPDACVIGVRWNDERAGGEAERTIETRSAI
ncbi:type IV pilus modification protein PilV [Pseudoxanthomonas sp. LH2527]|uniref:type IV pilus modification protein PilV n=1 Tax=Pseudoxanthomonas sp. LH2527 TaxID=2923249 RepID=UPI001F1450BB|nr:type IV pilus modification protein PilV [Pseudoxanthomonas sp. LH2527]MCH6484042.1 type IV pilus modification protein PilV [Pseudoxanthomonas sp. LH2527]